MSGAGEAKTRPFKGALIVGALAICAYTQAQAAATVDARLEIASAPPHTSTQVSASASPPARKLLEAIAAVSAGEGAIGKFVAVNFPGGVNSVSGQEAHLDLLKMNY